MTGREILSVYLEKGNDGSFVFTRGYGDIVRGKDVLVVEDVLTTGGSARKVVEAVRQAGGNVIGLSVLWNRNNIPPEEVGNPPHLTALINEKVDSWEEADCPACADGVPVNTDVGHGRQFLQLCAARALNKE